MTMPTVSTIGQSEDKADYSDPGTLPRMIAVLLTPFVFAWLTQVYGGWWSFAVMALCVAVAFLAYLKIEDPRRTPAYDPA